MKTEIKSGKGMSTGAKCAIWGTAALLYACETSPVIFRISNGRGTDGFLVAGMVISAAGLLIESMADLQKNAAKKKNPGRFVDTGLYRIVRCPNYFGEMLFWTGYLWEVCPFTGGSDSGSWRSLAMRGSYTSCLAAQGGLRCVRTGRMERTRPTVNM